MRKIKEVLRLHFEAGLSERQISKICRAGQGNRTAFPKAGGSRGSKLAVPPGFDDAALEKRLFPPPPSPSAGQRPQPDFAVIHKELKSPNVTLQLLWDEYKQEHPTGYSYSRFSELYGEWSKRLDLVLRQDHRAGEKTVRRSRRSDGTRHRPAHRRNAGSVCVCGGAGRQQLHLRRSHLDAGTAGLGQFARARLRVL